MLRRKVYIETAECSILVVIKYLPIRNKDRKLILVNFVVLLHPIWITSLLNIFHKFNKQKVYASIQVSRTGFQLPFQLNYEVSRLWMAAITNTTWLCETKVNSIKRKNSSHRYIHKLFSI